MHFLTLKITGNGIPFQEIEAAVGRAAQFAYHGHGHPIPTLEGRRMAVHCVRRHISKQSAAIRTR